MPKQLAALCPNVRVVAYSEDMMTAMQMVKSGLGITRMPCIRGDPLEGVIRVTALPWEGDYPIWLLTHSDLRNAPRVAAFMQSMAAGFVKRRGEYGG